jgi:hypothetical protein
MGTRELVSNAFERVNESKDSLDESDDETPVRR